MNRSAIRVWMARHVSVQALHVEPLALHSVLDALGSKLAMEDDEAGPTFAEMQKAAHVQRLASVIRAESVDVADGMGSYGRTADGVAVISIVGPLVNRYDWFVACAGLCSYDAVKLCIQAALDDGKVRAILLDVDSPGGEASGMLETAALIRAAAAHKPVWAVANSLAASAGYGLAGAAQRLVVPQLGTVGSIGVVAVHIDQSAADAEWGLKFTALHSGARKIDGWSHAPLSREARERFQAQMDEARLKFATAMAGYRNLSVDAVMATEAATYDDDEAVDAGLADAVASFDDTLAELTDRIRTSGSAPRGPAALNPGATMKVDTKGPAGKLSADQKDDETPEDKAPAKKDEGAKDGEKKPADKPEEPKDDKEAIAARVRAESVEIISIVSQANRMWPDLKADAAEFIKQGAKPDRVRNALWERAADMGPQISNATMPDTNTSGSVWGAIDAADQRKKGVK